MSDVLKACGNCGSDRIVTSAKFDADEEKVFGHVVACWDCAMQTGQYDTPAEAVAAWNRRTVTREQVEAMAEYYATELFRPSKIPAMLRAAGFKVAE